LIKNKNILPFPTTFTGELASNYLIDAPEQMRRQNEMKKVCQSCHSTDWTNSHFAQLDNTIIETDKMVLAATQLLQKAWDLKLADSKNPFDEAIEKKWITQWLFYANSVRYGAAMGGPDYASFKNGWWELTKNLQEIQEIIELRIDSQIK
jgi:hydroxylamine dehydrogenase